MKNAMRSPILLVLTLVACSKAAAPGPGSVDEALALPEAVALIEAEAAFQATVAAGPPAEFMRRAGELHRAAKQLRARLKDAEAPDVAELYNEAAGVSVLTGSGLEERSSHDASIRKNIALAIRRTLFTLREYRKVLRPLPYEE